MERRRTCKKGTGGGEVSYQKIGGRERAFLGRRISARLKGEKPQTRKGIRREKT